jgi:hypothetical protein
MGYLAPSAVICMLCPTNARAWVKQQSHSQWLTPVLILHPQPSMLIHQGKCRRAMHSRLHRPCRLLADWMGWRAGLSVYPATLRGKVAIVSGANSGIGLETTKALLQVCQPQPAAQHAVPQLADVCVSNPNSKPWSWRVRIRMDECTDYLTHLLL